MKFRFNYLLICSLLLGCADNASKEQDTMKLESSSAVEEENSMVSEEEAYTILAKQKLKELIDKKELAAAHPQFSIDSNTEFTITEIEDTLIKNLQFIEPFKTLSDSVKYAKTKVIFPSKIDTLLTFITTSTINIDGETFKTTKISFTPARLTKYFTNQGQKINTNEPKRVERFSINDLSFTWEEINACDCLFMVKTKDQDYERLYFGRFKGDTSGILQIGKNTKKLLVPLTKKRSQSRKMGSFWKETYQNDSYKIQLEASSKPAKIKGKFTYKIDFTLTNLTTKKIVKNLVLTNCKS